MTPAQTRAAAFHEAGHAVAGHRLGWQIEVATIEPKFGSDGNIINGHVVFAPRPAFADLPAHLKRAAMRQHLVDSAIVSAAGPAAQRRGAPGSRVPQGARVDHANVTDCARHLGTDPDGERSLRRYAEAEARALVRHDWPIIAAVADALLFGLRIYGETIRQIITTIDRERHAHAIADLAANGIPSEDECEAARDHRQRQSRRVERRHVERAVTATVLRQLTLSDQLPVSYAELVEAVRRDADARGLCPDTAAHKLRAMLDGQADAFRWRRCHPLTSTARH